MDIIPILIFAVTYLAIAIGGVPGFRIDRTGAAVIGAGLMLLSNTLTIDEAWAAIHHETLLLLFGMMIVVANLRLSGFFTLVCEWVVEHAHHPVTLLASIIAVAGFLSAFFVNDTMCIILTPLVLDITTTLRRNPMPYLLGVAMGSNIGSVATITGNPQNMMIGNFSGVGYRAFMAAMTPIALAGLVLCIVAIIVFHRTEFTARERVDVPRRKVRINRMLMYKSLAVSIAMIVCFFLGWGVPRVAMIAGALLPITRRVKPEKVYRQIDWPLLILFSGLFVVLAGIEKTQILHRMGDALPLRNPAILTFASAILSNLVSNVPAVLLFKPFVQQLADPAPVWLLLAKSTTLAGNLTILGSIANLIVVERARTVVKITFWDYARVGIPLTVGTLLLSLILP